MVVIDAENMILGRLAGKAAKLALLGQRVDIVNCEKAVVTGNKNQILAKYKQRRARGIPTSGPFYRRSPDRIVRRTIRGMLPHRRKRGKNAYKRIRCYTGLPEELEKEKFTKIPNADISKLTKLKYITVEQISKSIGGKV
ncbi:MAG: 50S ribosomal protein L13 [Candidatus Woesearchaeota archaeon]|nr:50S ribosomal protein L13 [Candidatus Woesearchaeota archaeon]